MKTRQGKALVKKLSKDKKVDYIDLNMAIYRRDEKKIPAKQLNALLDKFIDLVESEKMLCGGGAGVKRE